MRGYIETGKDENFINDKIGCTVDWLNGRLTAEAAEQRIRLAAEKLLG